MSAYLSKTEDEITEHVIDWSAGTFATGETIAADLGWAVTPDEAGGMTVASTASTTTATSAFLSGGLPGSAYQAVSRVRTSAGRELSQALVIRVSNA